VTAASFYGIPPAEEFTEFLHCTAAFVQNCYTEREVEHHTKINPLVTWRVFSK
jgi:hypothetical protein